MCAYFYELEDIFGSRIAENAIIDDSLDTYPSPEIDSSDLEVEDITVSNIIKDNTPSTSRKGVYSRTGLSEIMKVQSEMLQLKSKKIEEDSEIRRKEVDIKKKELLLKEREINLKEKEINSKERIQILELEMKERVAMEELRLKYNNN